MVCQSDLTSRQQKPSPPRLLVQAGLWLAPMLAGLATQLFNMRTMYGEGGRQGGMKVRISGDRVEVLEVPFVQMR